MSAEMSKDEDLAGLPIEVTDKNFEQLVEAIKVRKVGDIDGIRAVYGDSSIKRPVRALEALGLIKDYVFTETGKMYAYETDPAARRRILTKAILSYNPYGDFLTHLLLRGFPVESSLEDITNYWGKNGTGVSPDNRKRGASTFGNIIELAGLGKFIKGWKTNPTRVKWDDTASESIRNSGTESTTPGPGHPEADSENGPSPDTQPVEPDPTVEPRPAGTPSHSRAMPTISITVDMTDWEIDRIRAFLKMLNEIGAEPDGSGDPVA